jgi:hypothetical protein
MRWNILFGYIVVIILCAIVATYIRASIHTEHFQSDEGVDGVDDLLPVQELEVRTPLDIYYTDDVKTCDTPGGFYVGESKNDAYVIDYSFDVAWYKKLYDSIRGVVGNYNPTPRQNAVLMQLQYVIDQYPRFPFGSGSCKVTVPNWGSVMLQRNSVESDERILFGDIENNKERGTPQTWAFIAHPDPNVPSLSGGDILFATDGADNENYFKIRTSTGQEYTRAALKSFSADVARQLYCSETNEYNNYNIPFGIKIHPATGRAVFIKNSREVDVADVTDTDIIVFFAPFFKQEYIKNASGSEELYKVPFSQTYNVSRVIQTPCGVLLRKFTPSQVVVTFSDVAVVKTIATNMTDGKYLKGDSNTLKEKSSLLDKDIEEKRYKAQDLFERYKELQRKERDIKDNYDTVKRKYSDAYWEAIRYGNLARRRNWSRWTNRRLELDAIRRRDEHAVELKNIKNSLDTKRSEVGTMHTSYKDTIGEIDALVATKKKLQEYVDFMNDELIRDIRSMLVTNKLVASSVQQVYVRGSDGENIPLPPLYWRYLSYDGNLYVVL